MKQISKEEMSPAMKKAMDDVKLQQAGELGGEKAESKLQQSQVEASLVLFGKETKMSDISDRVWKKYHKKLETQILPQIIKGELKKMPTVEQLLEQIISEEKERHK